MSLQKRLPWTKSPLIVNGPMGGPAGADLAVAVSQAGGVGLIGSTADMGDLRDELSKATQALARDSRGLLPVGVGLLSFAVQPPDALPVLEAAKPAIVWLFAAHNLSDYAAWADEIRRILPESQVWVQVCSVAAAVEVARDARPDVLCLQGADAGGHGYVNSAGIISLVPEVSDALAAAGLETPLLAAGGIVDARGAAAALALGAQGVVLGTRFLATPESRIHQRYRDMILRAADGSQSTVRSKLFDNVAGPNRWPMEYDGRSIRTASFKDHEDGVVIEKIRELHNQAVKADDKGFEEQGKGRANAWAGTGVGLVKKQQPAREVVEELRSGIGAIVDRVKQVSNL